MTRQDDELRAAVVRLAFAHAKTLEDAPFNMATSADKRRYIHRHRWETVRYLRAQKAKLGVKIGWADKDIYRTASQRLQGHGAQGGPDAVEKSYKRVQRAYKAGDKKSFGPLDTGN